MKLVMTIVLTLGCAASLAASEMVVQDIGVAVVEDFDGFIGTFDSLPPGVAVSNDGSNCLTEVDGDEFRPPHPGGTTEGACRPWDLGDGNHALGYQPTESEFTPGFFMMAVSNGTGAAASRVEVFYDIVCYNNENRASSLSLEYSVDGSGFTAVSSVRYVSPAAKDVDPRWEICARSATINLKKPLRPGARFVLRWYGDDAGGSGSRDEYGIDNVRLVLRSRRGTVIAVP